MDIEKLIEHLKTCARLGDSPIMDGFAVIADKRKLEEAATALSTLQAENEQLKDQLYDGEGVNLVNYWRQQAKVEENGPRNCQAENEKLRAELEQAPAERDAAVESIPHECKTCVYHTVFFNGCTPDHDCTNPDGGCSNNCDRWKWRGQKED